ncbi:CoA-binding protein [Alkalimarinus sediminis]|uniref:CoA-binding protein n=1 Tax=Alkalimarinus sediminis TaxID=1632866 RepID=A0A9E8KJ83_9ALTE|nr:CoA-binding protein [Alkalimarinus sediminis]UZW74751.1 CoA-binding protein [Alkalimarinus sediminis]
MTYSDPHNDEQISTILHQVKTIALVGASNKEDRPSYRVMRFMQQKGFKIIPVSPRLAGQTLLGETVYESLDSIPQAVDMVDLFVNSERVTPIIESAIALSPSIIWMQIGVINIAAAELAKAKGINVVMDRCPKKEIERLGLFSGETSS